MSSWRQRRWLLEHHQDLHNDYQILLHNNIKDFV